MYFYIHLQTKDNEAARRRRRGVFVIHAIMARIIGTEIIY